MAVRACMVECRETEYTVCFVSLWNVVKSSESVLCHLTLSVYLQLILGDKYYRWKTSNKEIDVNVSTAFVQCVTQHPCHNSSVYFNTDAITDSRTLLHTVFLQWYMIM